MIVEVLHGYHIETFESVEIRAPFLPHGFILEKSVFELYRRKKIALSELLLPNDFNLSPHDVELFLKK